jgi:plastocyanin
MTGGPATTRATRLTTRLTTRLAATLAAALFAYAGPAHGTNVEVQARDAGGATVENVVVVLDPLDAPAPRTAARASIDQVARQFVPRVSVLQAGTVVNFPNSDHVRHQVYSFSPAKTFSLKLYAGADAPPVTFDKPGLVVLGCNIHDTMIAYVAVVETPWFARTGADGRARIDAPPGRYRLRVWHPELAAAVPPRELRLAGATSPLSLSLTLAPAAGIVAGFPE